MKIGEPARNEQGLQRQLTAGQMAMVAVGGSIGTGLLLGSAAALEVAGPAVILTFLFAAFVTWTVTVPMDPQVLPDTELRLHLSPHWLSLRFTTQSQRAARLISLHRPRLLSQLEHMANLPHGIDIEVT